MKSIPGLKVAYDAVNMDYTWALYHNGFKIAEGEKRLSKKYCKEDFKNMLKVLGVEGRVLEWK